MVVRNVKGQFVKGQNIVDKSGERYGRLIVISLSERRSGRKTFWNCVCDCGNEKVVRSDSLGLVNSCGCLKKERDKINLTANHSHKQSGTRLYHTWQGMKARCYYEDSDSYTNYGGRGIAICDEWLNDFQTFYDWAYLTGYDDELTIERKDVNGNYEPGNCEWISANEQAGNRRNTVWVEYKGEVVNLKTLSDITGLKYGTLNSRFKRGLRGEKLTAPPSFEFKNKKHGNTNLLANDVKVIKELLKQNIPLADIGVKYNVSKSCIHNIKTGKTWKNI